MLKYYISDFCDGVGSKCRKLYAAYKKKLNGNCLTVSKSVGAEFALYKKCEKDKPIINIKLNSDRSEIPVIKLAAITAVCSGLMLAVCLLYRLIFTVKYRKRW